MKKVRSLALSGFLLGKLVIFKLGINLLFGLGSVGCLGICSDGVLISLRLIRPFMRDFIGMIRSYFDLFLNSERHKGFDHIALFPSMANQSNFGLIGGEGIA